MHGAGDNGGGGHNTIHYKTALMSSLYVRLQTLIRLNELLWCAAAASAAAPRRPGTEPRIYKF